MTTTPEIGVSRQTLKVAETPFIRSVSAKGNDNQFEDLVARDPDPDAALMPAPDAIPNAVPHLISSASTSTALNAEAASNVSADQGTPANPTATSNKPILRSNPGSSASGLTTGAPPAAGEPNADGDAAQIEATTDQVSLSKSAPPVMGEHTAAPDPTDHAPPTSFRFTTDPPTHSLQDAPITRSLEAHLPSTAKLDPSHTLAAPPGTNATTPQLAAPARAALPSPAPQPPAVSMSALMTIIPDAIDGSDQPSDRLVVQLDPPELGRISIDFSFNAQGLQTVTIYAENSDALRQLRAMHADLVASLERNGIPTKDLEYRHENPSQNHSNAGSDTPGDARFIKLTTHRAYVEEALTQDRALHAATPALTYLPGQLNLRL